MLFFFVSQVFEFSCARGLFCCYSFQREIQPAIERHLDHISRLPLVFTLPLSHAEAYPFYRFRSNEQAGPRQ